MQGTVTSSFEVSGGEAAGASTVDPTLVSAAPPAFGIDSFDSLVSADPAGDPQTQAGAHPFSMTTDISFNTVKDPVGGPLYPVESTRDVIVDLPAGLVGDPTAADRCTNGELANNSSYTALPLCPSGSQVGTVVVPFGSSAGGGVFGPLPLFNMVPPPGVPARFGFQIIGTVITLDASVRTGGDYGIRVTSKDVAEFRAAGTQVTLWGVPADPIHDGERACPGKEAPWLVGITCTSSAPRKAFLRNPTSCGPPGVGLPTTVSMDSWEHPGKWVSASSRSHLLPGFPAAPSEWGAEQGIEGCERQPFAPSIGGGPPANASAGAPSGFAFDISLPQSQDPESLATADMRKAVVTLPEGVRINPASAQGLAGCSPAQIDIKGEGQPQCPDASKVGSVTIDTPLLSEPLSGSVYVATPYENPFGSLMAIYLVAQGDGVTIKLAGDVQLNPLTGQIVTTVDNAPQAPFTRVHVQFDGGPRAALSLPRQCGTYTTHAELTSWSGRTVNTESSFTIDQGEEGACPGNVFSPGFLDGSTSTRAGGFSPLVLSISRSDSEQPIGSIGETLPPGVAAILRGVPRCPDAQAATGACPESSRIGTVTVGSGTGSNPLFLQGGVYLTGPYDDGPFGEVVVVPAVAGPFNLGDVVVRGSIRVDPHTAQASVVSDPLPQFVNGSGIPSDVRRIYVTVDRPGFTFNPTDCAPLQATATLTSTAGTVAHLSARYQATDCASLAFKPKFTASTSARSSRREGASLDVKVAFPKGAQANIAKVRVSLPRQLPSRLDTLKLACVDRVFESNPAACPAPSRVGTATARTPLLAATLSGPAYIVSHGGAAFPDLEIVLQGEGVTFILDGHTDIDPKTNVTTSTFATVPDVPVTSFALSLPRGVHSVLAAPGGNLCADRLVMPTALTAQNGAVLRQSTRIEVTGCRPALRVLSHSVHGPAASVRVSTPLPGTLSAGGDGIASVRRRVGAGEVALTLALTGAERRLLAAHPGRRARVRVRLALAGARGARLHSSLTLLIG